MMKSRPFFATMLAVLVMAGVVPVTAAQTEEEPSPYRVVGYYPSYSIYEDYFVTDINADQLTHLNYAAADISENGQCVSSDVWTDTQYAYPGDKPNLRLRGNIRQLQLLRGEHPNLKILITIGGWEQSDHFSEVAQTPESRARFVRSCMAFVREYLFDGIDIDWRYPVSGGQVEGLPEDRENFTLLLEEFRTQLDEAGAVDNKAYLLTMLAPAVETLYKNIDLALVHPYLDWINLMSFGFQGEWSEVASHHAPLFGNTRDPRGSLMQENYNVSATVETFLDAGVPAEKLVVGIPFYAQTWRNVKPNDYFGLYQTADGVPTGTRPGGVLYYRDLLPLLQNDIYTRFFDEEAGVPWLYSDEERIAISYEDPESVRYKVHYVRQMDLGGVMIWQISYDDKDQPLLDVVNEALNEEPATTN